MPLPLNNWIYEIVSGGAKGVDSLGEKFADDQCIDKTVMHANWDKFGQSGGHYRNRRMALYGTHLIAIPLPTSRGTQNMIEQMKTMKKPVFVYDINTLSGYFYVGTNA